MSDFWEKFIIGLKWVGGFAALSLGCSMCMMCLSSGTADDLAGPCTGLGVGAFAVYAIGGILIGAVGEIGAKMQRDARIRDENARELAKEIELRKKAEKEAAMKQRQNYAAEFKRKADDVAKQCEHNARKAKDAKLTPMYETIVLQRELCDTIDNVSISLQRLDDVVTELKTMEDK